MALDTDLNRCRRGGWVQVEVSLGKQPEVGGQEVSTPRAGTGTGMGTGMGKGSGAMGQALP